MDLDLTGVFIFLGVVCGVVGWGFIELVVWLSNSVTIG
jgi:hypothetical protein